MTLQPGRRRRSAPGPSRWSRTRRRTIALTGRGRARRRPARPGSPTWRATTTASPRRGPRSRSTSPQVDRRYGLAVEPGGAAAAGRRPADADVRRQRASVDETLVEDFSKHPFAGLPVTVRLTAEDATGQTGEQRAGRGGAADAALLRSAGARRWSSSGATCSGRRRTRRRVTQVLRAVTNHPDDVFDSPRAYLVVRTAIRRLAQADEDGDGRRRCATRSPRRCGRRRCRSRTATSATRPQRLARAKERLQQALRERRQRRGDRPADGRAAPGDPRLHGADGRARRSSAASSSRPRSRRARR